MVTKTASLAGRDQGGVVLELPPLRNCTVRAIIPMQGGVLVLNKTAKVRDGDSKSFETPGGSMEAEDFDHSIENPLERLAAALRKGCEREVVEETGLTILKFGAMVYQGTFEKRKKPGVNFNLFVFEVTAVTAQAAEAVSKNPKLVPEEPEIRDIILNSAENDHCGLYVVKPKFHLPRFGLGDEPIDPKSANGIEAYWQQQYTRPVNLLQRVS